MAKKISVVVTVFNEQDSISSLLTSLFNQTVKAFEIIVVDGGSTDATWFILKKFAPPLETEGLISLRGGRGVILNRSEGRNLGVSIAKGDIIAFTDAGCVPEKDWLENLTKNMGDSVVSGFYKGLPQNIFQKCLVPYVLVMPDRIPDEFLPSTRSMAITKKLFLSSGGFDEKLWHNEDYAFAHKLKNMGVNFYFAPQAIVGWLPRKDLKSAAWMFLRFAIGDAQAGIFRPKVKNMAIRYYIFLFLFFINHWFGLLIIPYLLWAISKNYKYVKNIGAFFWLPVLQLTSDTCVLFGTLVGLLSRVK